jgi:hypothetical protein
MELVDDRRKYKQGHQGEAGRFSQLTQRELAVGQHAFEARPLPHLSAGLLDPGHIPEFTSRSVFRLCLAHTAGHPLLHLFLKVLLDLLTQIVVDLATVEKLAELYLTQLLINLPAAQMRELSDWLPISGK